MSPVFRRKHVRTSLLMQYGIDTLVGAVTKSDESGIRVARIRLRAPHSKEFMVRALTSSCRCGSCPIDSVLVKDAEPDGEYQFSYNVVSDFGIVGLDHDSDDYGEKCESVFVTMKRSVEGLGAMLHALEALDPASVPTPEAYAEFWNRIHESGVLSTWRLQSHEYDTRTPRTMKPVK